MAFLQKKFQHQGTKTHDFSAIWNFVSKNWTQKAWKMRLMFFGMVKWLQWVRFPKIVQIHTFDPPGRSQRIRWPWNFHWDISQVVGILLHTWHGLWKCFPASHRRFEVKKLKIEKCIFWRVHRSKNSHWAQNECHFQNIAKCTRLVRGFSPKASNNHGIFTKIFL